MAQTTFSGPVVSTNGLQAGTTGTTLTFVKRGTIAVDPASLATLAGNETTLTITGAAVGDTIILHPPAAGLTAGMINGGAVVSAADTVKLRLFNGSAGTIDEASATWEYTLIRS